MNAFEAAVRLYYAPEQWQRIQQTRIGIAGAGGLGSNIAVALVRSGFKYLEIVDFDVVEAKNLNRQFYFLDEVGRSKVEVLAERLRSINPDVEIVTHQTRLTPTNIGCHFESAECLCEAFDGPQAKQMFLEAFLGSRKFLVMGSGMAGIGNQTPISIRKLKGNLYMVGDGVTPVGPENPPCAPRVSACAGLMASVILEHVCG
ncbi:MAG: sulfur carrier protein ThiS adenylyltransferase ThiF [Verrucomicrobia bacterium]|nr:sulfur carrier protein ThiS adenylyltransferase ThiF [Verrucomicrobiota bacterium]